MSSVALLLYISESDSSCLTQPDESDSFDIMDSG